MFKSAAIIGSALALTVQAEKDALPQTIETKWVRQLAALGLDAENAEKIRKFQELCQEVDALHKETEAAREQFGEMLEHLTTDIDQKVRDVMDADTIIQQQTAEKAKNEAQNKAAAIAKAEKKDKNGVAEASKEVEVVLQKLHEIVTARNDQVKAAAAAKKPRQIQKNFKSKPFGRKLI